MVGLLSDLLRLYEFNCQVLYCHLEHPSAHSGNDRAVFLQKGVRRRYPGEQRMAFLPIAVLRSVLLADGFRQVVQESFLLQDRQVEIFDQLLGTARFDAVYPYLCKDRKGVSGGSSVCNDREREKRRGLLYREEQRDHW